ncbi:MAG TPA: GNAT family N-acetyltransferase [Sphingomicrobium sp.]|nr:GNAT family N-acetyltransferase [Sphingomicrobium sp.]
MRRALMSKRADSLTLLLRLAEPDEHAQLEELQRRASLELPEYREELLANPDAIHLPPAQIANGQVIVAELDGEPAGFAAVVAGEIDGLFVEPDLWGSGIGKALVEAATHEARLSGMTLKVTANPSARLFYQSCGFSVEGEEQTRFGPALRMSR